MEEQLTLELTVNEINTVLEGLSELPARRSMELINRIIGQATQQQEGAGTPEQSDDGKEEA